MISTNELRLGNLLRVTNINNPREDDAKWYGQIVTVTRINGKQGSNRIYADTFDGEWSFLDFQLSPIPLTEDILKAMGFTYNGFWAESTSFIKDGIYIWIGNKSGLIFFSYKMEDEDYSREIPHVHDLQNLFFSLTGRELTMDLSKETHP